MALPNTTKNKPRAAAEEPVVAHAATNGKKMDKDMAKAVMDDLLDSLIDNPSQTHAFRRDESSRLACQYGVSIYAIAGVRASLSAGRYGPESKLIAARKRSRTKAAKAAPPAE